ncbi:MAG: hypothetical protein ABII12_04255 [Planctomycetota bacterium]
MSLATWFVTVYGCRKADTRFDIISYADAENPEQFTEHFETGAFSVDAQGGWDFVFEIPMSLIGLETGASPTEEPEPPSPPAADSGADDEPVGGPLQEDVWMAQFLLVHVFWKPKPGTTFANSSQTNASIDYCLVTSDNAISYEGAGFVSFALSRDGRRATGKIESSTLVPVRTHNEPIDLFGPCRLSGTFVTLEDKGRVVSVQQRLRRKLGRPAALPRKSPYPSR